MGAKAYEVPDAEKDEPVYPGETVSEDGLQQHKNSLI